MLCTIVICYYVTQKASALQWGCDGCDEVTFSLQCSPRVVGWVAVQGVADTSLYQGERGEANLVLGRKISICSTAIPCHNV